MACAPPQPVAIHASFNAADMQASALSTRTLTVLTYNIEGLGWPARGRGERAAALREIGERLEELRKAGQAPDIVMFQEMFSSAAKKAVDASGYPAIASGPHRTTRARGSTKANLPGKSKLLLGEMGIHFYGSGLAIASRYPIMASTGRAYGRRSCAGLDCLANKGVMLARISIPGLPGPVDLYNTHMNSQRASRATVERSLAAHERQALEALQFVAATHDGASPVIVGGDFNMRKSAARWDYFTQNYPFKLVHRECAAPGAQCDVRMNWRDDSPWMDTQDLQLFWPGQTIGVRPIRMENMFDGGPSGPRLSDHDGLLVTYELSWPTEARPMRASC